MPYKNSEDHLANQRKLYRKNKANKKAYVQKNREAIRYGQILIKYGLTKEDYEKMLEDQKFSCKICKRHMLELDRRLAVDHCHETGKIRGLLCRNCNLGLGFFQDDVSRLNTAIAYLNPN